MKKSFTVFLLFVFCSVNFCFATEMKKFEEVEQTPKIVTPFVIPADIEKYNRSEAYEKTNAVFIDWAKENLGYSQEEAEKLLKSMYLFNISEPLPDAFYEMVSNKNYKIFLENNKNGIYPNEIDQYANMVKFYDIYKKVRPDDEKYLKGIVAKGNYFYYADKAMSNEKSTDKQKVKKFERSVAFADIMNKSNGSLGLIYVPEGEYGRYIESYKYHSNPYKILSPIAVIPAAATHIAFAAILIPVSIIMMPYTLWVIIESLAADAH